MSTQHTETPLRHTDTPPAGRESGRRVIATFNSYEDAARAVDVLADNNFPVERVSIVGRGLHTVERVTGRMTVGKAVLRGAVTGAVTGALIGWLFWVFNWFAPVVAAGWLIVDGLWFGGLVGALLGLLAVAATGGRHEFASALRMEADRYELQVDEPVAHEAADVLARLW
jgi:hypothetical protein